MAALMADVGRVRIAGREGRDLLVELSEDKDASVPSATAAICLATGGVNVPNALRTVVGFESTWLEREMTKGSLYARRLPPLVESHILRITRAFVNELAPRDAATAPKSVLDALSALAVTPGIDPTLARILVQSLGMLPTGCVVEFETGEWGVVVGPSKVPNAFDRPVVRLVTDRSGRPLNPPREVDLAVSSGTRVFPRIANVISPNVARFNVTRVFVA
jgi:hypothetical protein